MIGKISKWIVLILVISGVGGAWIFVGETDFFRTPVSVAKVERGKAVDAVPAVVEVRAKREMDLRSELAGRVEESFLEVGKQVQAGEVLVRLDKTDLLREMERVRLELETEKALREIGSPLRFDLAEMEEEWARRETLFQEARVSKRELDEQERRVARLRDEIALEEVRQNHRLEMLRIELERLEEEIRKTVLRAPASGTVLTVFAHAEDWLNVGGIAARLLSEERIVEATLSEENFTGIEIGDPVTVRFLSYGSRLFQGTVADVLPAANPDTQRYTVHLSLEMPTEMLIPGITGEASIVLGEQNETLLIPRRALVGRDVFVLRDGVAQLQQVEIGFISLNSVEIRGGLEEGETVAVENLDRLRHGDRVRF